MKKSAGVICFFMLMISALSAQVLPKEGSVLNYRLLYFSFPAVEKAAMYNVEIATGQQDGEDSFKAHIVKTLSCTDKKIMAEVPYWGCQYTWRVVFNNGRGNEVKSPVYHFSTDYTEGIDTERVRLRILQQSGQYKDALIFLDNSRALYDMEGHAVWFLPEKTGIAGSPRDLKLSPMGTITLLLDQNAYEVDYNGKILWKGPDKGTVSGGNSERYHHEFTRLANGHYMILGEENAEWTSDKPENAAGLQGNMKRVYPFGTIIEYDEKGDLVWSWKSSSYFKGSDLVYYKPRGPMPDMVDVHENAFYFDEETKMVYLGFRNIDRIIKLKYPEGIVMDTYGPIYKPGADPKKNNLFCGQHSICRTSNGNLCVFNNNSCDSGIARIIVMKELPQKDRHLQYVWEYVCPVDKKDKFFFPSGGNVAELSDHSFVVCLGVIVSNVSFPTAEIFIVNQEKKIQWSAIPESWNAEEKQWRLKSQYKVRLIEKRKDLEQLIWKSENGE